MKPKPPPAPAPRPKAGPRSPGTGDEHGPMMTELRRRAEVRMRKQRKAAVQGPSSKTREPEEQADARRSLHELQVHQIELELQNDELKQTRDRTEVLLEKYTDLYDFAPVGYFSLDEAGRIIESNLSGAALLGVERASLSQRHLQNFIAPSSRAAFLDFLAQVFAGTVQQDRELALVKADATDLWTRFRGTSALAVSEGRRWCRVSVSDITPFKRAEEALRESETRFRIMADAISQLAWQARPDGFITWYNRRWYDYTGTTLEQMAGSGWQSVHDPEVLPKVLKRWKASLSAGKPFEMCFPLRGADGLFRQFLTRAVPHKDQRGRLLQWFGTNTDIEDQERAAETKHRLEVLAASNVKLEQEIVRRKSSEQALKESELRQRAMAGRAIEMQGQLRHLSRHILKAQEDERKRISRELHDEVAQTLVGINIHLEALARVAEVDPLALKRHIAGTQKAVSEAVDAVHRFARDLRPTLLDDLGLIPALHAYMKEFTERTKVRIHFTAIAGVEQLSSARRTVLYRVAQSALTNIAQHAHATKVEAVIDRVPGAIRMEIRDNGRSFDVEQVLFAKRHKRLGLIGTRERVEMVGGIFSIESAPGKGTIVRAEVPVGNLSAAKSGAPTKEDP